MTKIKTLNFRKRFISKLKIFVLILVLSVFIVVKGGAQTTLIWEGTHPNQTTQWQTKQNWKPQQVPTGVDDVIIPILTDTKANYPIITITAACRTLAIASGASLSLNSGSLTVSNTLIIQSDANGTGSFIVNGGSLTATATVQRYLPSTKWHIVSSPASGQQLGSFVTGNLIVQDATAGDFDLAPYNTSLDKWSSYTLSGNTSPFEIGAGYVMRRTAAGIVTFAGTINTGNVPTPSLSTAGNGWNALGNPYTSAIIAKGTGSILNALIAEGKLPVNNQALYVWDQSGDDYYTISNINTATFPKDPSTTLSNLDQANIAVGQGFIIRAAATGSVNFTPSMQVSQPTTAFKSAEVPSPALRLTVNAGDMINQTIVAFEKDMTYGLDPSYDAGKLKGNPDLALYSKLVDGSSNVDFAVQALPDVSFEEVRIPLGLDFPAGGEVTFSLEMSNGFRTDAEVFLEDIQNLTLTRLNVEDAKYTTNIASGTEGDGRFNLLVTKYTATGTDNPAAENNFTVFNHGNIIYINGPANAETQFSLYSIDGKLWTSRQAENLNQNRIDASPFPAGIYMLKINNNGLSQTQKLVIMK
jgi:trimeric autotransporter adhesin